MALEWSRLFVAADVDSQGSKVPSLYAFEAHDACSSLTDPVYT